MTMWEEVNALDYGVPADFQLAWDRGEVRLITISEQGMVAVTDSLELAVITSLDREYQPELHYFLGTCDETLFFVIHGDADTQIDLRAVVSQLPDRDVQLVLRGSALVQYHAHHRFCPQCGALTRVDMLGNARFCESCSTQQFPRTDPAIIVAVTNDQDRIVLGHHQGWMENRYALFAGFVEAGESLEQAVIREVAEEVSLSLTDIEYAGSQPWPLPRSLMIGFTAKAQAGEIAVDGEEIEDARWFSREDLRAAVQSKEITVPPAGSIGHRLIFAWYGQPTFD